MMKKKQLSPEEVERQKSRFEDWQKTNPSKTFKDYFAETVEAKLQKGRSHETLGGNLRQGDYATSGQGTYQRLLNYGLKPGDICVDYGCGTLRVGQHIIDYLGPRAYWGLDISQYLLDEGRKLIGEKLWSEKQPQLRIISPESVAEVAATKPDMMFSFAVLLHVHPDELGEYVDNVMTVIGKKGQYITDANLMDGDTVQYSGRSWAHSQSEIEKLLVERGGKMEILTDGKFKMEALGKVARRYIVRIVHKDRAAA
jgi:SAM-dependent methyltransferase